MGSGRWGWFHRKKRTVEECRALDLGAILRGRDPTPGLAGTLTWSRRDEVVASVGYVIAGSPGGGLAVRLLYTWTPRIPPGAAPQEVSLDVRLEPGAVPRGRSRWWGRCPLAAGGVPCGRRIGKLYLPPGSMYFGCRHCHRLTYHSRQGHDPRVTRLLRDPEALLRMAEDPRRLPIRQLGLILSALTELQLRTDRWLRRFEKTSGRGSE